MVYPKLKDKHLHESLFNPEETVDKLKKKFVNLPKKYLLFYEDYALTYLKKKYKPQKVKINPRMTIWVYKNIGFVRMMGIGSPYVTGYLENLIALGGNIFINIGLAGGLHKQGFFLCIKSLRDEGTSYHYLPHGDYSFPDKNLTRKLGKSMKNLDIEFKEGTSWTTDAFYRETKKEVEKYSKRGISTVEMESSALFAVAKYRKVKMTSAFVVSDVLKDKWDNRMAHFNTKNGLKRLLDAGVDCLSIN